MRFVIQRVNHATVKVDGEITGSVEKGFLVLIGVGKNDTKSFLQNMVSGIWIILRSKRDLHRQREITDWRRYVLLLHMHLPAFLNIWHWKMNCLQLNCKRMFCKTL